MTPFAKALASASRGIDWSRPCLLWLADYVTDVTGSDPAAAWRAGDWNERRALRAMADLGAGCPGDTPVQRTMRAIAERDGWERVERPAGNCVGVFSVGEEIGVPAIFDGRCRWLIATATGARLTIRPPTAIWRLPCSLDSSHC